MPGRSVPSSQVASLAAEVGRLEADAARNERKMEEHEAEHTEWGNRVARLERELDSARGERIAAYGRWWQAREDRNRALHVARRLRRRLARLRRRCRE